MQSWYSTGSFINIYQKEVCPENYQQLKQELNNVSVL